MSAAALAAFALVALALDDRMRLIAAAVAAEARLEEDELAVPFATALVGLATAAVGVVEELVVVVVVGARLVSV